MDTRRRRLTASSGDGGEEPQPLEGIAEADAHLGREVPLPRVPLPLTRWVDVYACGPRAVEVAWNLDDTRDAQPGRVSLYAGEAAPPDRSLGDGATDAAPIADGVTHREAPLARRSRRCGRSTSCSGAATACTCA